MCVVVFRMLGSHLDLKKQLAECRVIPPPGICERLWPKPVEEAFGVWQNVCVYNAYRRVVLRRIDATVLLGLEILGCECGAIERRSSKKPCSWDAWWPAKLVFAAWSWWIEKREAVDGPTAPEAVPGHRGSKVQAIYLCGTINRFQIPTPRTRMQQSLHPQAPMSHPNDLCASDTAKTLFKLFFETQPLWILITETTNLLRVALN